MENWELIKHLSTSGLHGEIPVVVLSGLDERETESRCVEYGVVRYFLKPFNPVELMDSIRDLVSTLVD
jgi:CheY-like chemotaxis protein